MIISLRTARTANLTLSEFSVSSSSALSLLFGIVGGRKVGEEKKQKRYDNNCRQRTIIDSIDSLIIVCFAVFSTCLYDLEPDLLGSNNNHICKLKMFCFEYHFNR